MHMKTRIVIGLTVSFILGLSTNIYSQKSPSKGDAAVSPTPSGIVNETHIDNLDQLIAAVYSRRCATSQGVCWVRRPKQLGEACFCGAISGTIVR